MPPPLSFDDFRKQMFGGLGRATNRGIKKCPKCGTINGTRGNSCKNKSCDVIFRSKGSKKKTTTDACRITVNNTTAEIYSVRLRDRGPDYRSFVQLAPAQSIPVFSSSSTGIESHGSHGTLPKCFVSACSRNRTIPCAHIKAAQKCFTIARRIPIKHSVLDSMHIPEECKQIISTFVRTELPDLYVQRCSKTSFVVKCNPSTRHHVGYLHILFFKPNREDGATDPKFLCSCRPFRISPSNEADTQQNSENPLFDSSNKFCIHYYACLLAFASNEDLATEFADYLSAGVCQGFAGSSITSVSEIGRNEEASISAHIMRENVSLMDGLPVGDETTLTTLNNVQLDGGFADHIIMTNSENGMIFTGSAVIEAMDEVDSGRLTRSDTLNPSTQNQQVVCQIFSSQLPESMMTSGGNNETVHILTDSVLRNHSDVSFGESSGGDISISLCSTTGACVITTTDPAVSWSSDTQTKTTSIISLIPKELLSTDHKTSEEKIILAAFEKWLASVNERINASMNYQLSGKPDPLVYYVCHEHFDILKERITSGFKKKRLPNQTQVVVNQDRAPIGNFMKYVWKITNIVHVLHIFHSSLVPLKINQFFVQHSNGSYSEWIPSNDSKEGDGPKAKSIVPVLHSTSLKIGKTDVTVRESIPFSIEWIPDILPQTRTGELTLSFQFSHTGPIHTDEERRNTVAPLQKLIQSQSLPS